MKNYSLSERSNLYSKSFPSWPAPRTDERWLDGIWILVNYEIPSLSFYFMYPLIYFVSGRSSGPYS